MNAQKQQETAMAYQSGIRIVGEQKCSMNGCYLPAKCEHADYPHLGKMCDFHYRKLTHRIERGWTDPTINLSCTFPTREREKTYKIYVFSGHRIDSDSKMILSAVIRSTSKNAALRRFNRLFPQLRGVQKTATPHDCETPAVYIPEDSPLFANAFPHRIIIEPERLIACCQIVHLNNPTDVRKNIRLLIEKYIDIDVKFAPPGAKEYEDHSSNDLMECWIKSFVLWSELFGGAS